MLSMIVDCALGAAFTESSNHCFLKSGWRTRSVCYLQDIEYYSALDLNYNFSMA